MVEFSVFLAFWFWFFFGGAMERRRKGKGKEKEKEKMTGKEGYVVLVRRKGAREFEVENR